MRRNFKKSQTFPHRAFAASVAASLVLFSIFSAPFAHAIPLPFTTSSSSTSAPESKPADLLQAGLSFGQYAAENQATPRLDLRLRWKSLNDLHQINVTSFVEFGPTGNMTFDPDPVVVRVKVAKQSRLFFGRTQPFAEGPLHRTLEATDAMGAVWAQNQLDPLNRRVTGWIGGGARVDFLDNGKLTLVTQFSPIFLPNFTPSLGIDDQGRLNASRFARLPPQWVQYQNGVMPIHYQIDTGPIRDIVFQNQFFLGLEHSSKTVEASLSAWNAPRPDPQIAAVGVLDPTTPDLAASVVARPSFPRQNFLGARFRLPRIFGQPELQAAVPFGMGSALLQQGALISARWQPFQLLSLGYLEALGSARATEADYTDRLIWGQVLQPFAKIWSIGARVEQHLLPTRQGQWNSVTLAYKPTRSLTFQARASFLSGDDGSYFGAWRAYDSFSLGAQSIW